tara:strand:+ start:1336 stop:1896 length:561 start_codon:yes stop_codon:yes gene_type:complete
MKKILTTLILCFPMLAWADDFDSNQFTLKIQNSNYGIETRQYTSSERSHIQIEKYVGKWKFAYRYDENGSKTEHRPRIDYKLYDNGLVYIKPRVEYRYYEGTRNDYWRVRSAIGLRVKGMYLEVNPMLRLGSGYSNDLSVDEYQTKLGYKFPLGTKAQLNMFVQRDSDKDFNKTNMLFGTSLGFRF